ncbi:MAG: HAD family phosphatase [Niabella sp.]
MIRNIILDFGGVLFNIDYHKTTDAFVALGFTDFNEMFTQHNADELFQSLETGSISTPDFYKRLQMILEFPVEEYELESAWNAMLLGYRKESLDFLKSLSEKYNLYLLSNTNEIHYNRFSKMLPEQTPYQSLESFFTKAWFSHRIHLRKPDRQTFEFVLNDGGLKPEETLFIDDSYSNLGTPEALGIHTHLLLPEERIETLKGIF